MASNNRIPPLRLRHPIPSPHLMHPNPYAPPIHHRHPHGNFPPFEMFTHPEVMEQKLSAQHVEIQKLAAENQRLAATHVTLRQDLAASKHELQLMNIHAVETMSEKEQQMRSLVDKMSVMEAELKGAEPIKMQLQKAHAEAKGLVSARQNLISSVQQLTNELQKALAEAKQIPEFLSELDAMRQEYHHCRATYDYEKKLYSDHLESLQVMEKNYAAMSVEVEKLRAELTNSSNFDPRTGMPYGGPGVYNENFPAGNYAPAQNAYGVGGQHVHNPYAGGGTNDNANPASGNGIIGSSNQGNSPQVMAQMGPTNSQTAHEAVRGSAQASFVAGGYSYDPYGRLVVAGYDPQTQQAMGQGYNVPMGYSDAYEPHRAQLVYDMQRAAAHEIQTGAYYVAQKTAGHEVSGGNQGQVPVANAVPPYGSGAPSNRAGTGYESLPKSENQVGK